MKLAQRHAFGPLETRSLHVKRLTKPERARVRRWAKRVERRRARQEIDP